MNENDLTPQSFMAKVSAWITGKDGRLQQLETSAAASAAELATIKATLAQTQSDLATAKTTIGTLEKQVETVTAENKQLKEAKATADKTEVDRQANLLAGQKLASVGVKAIAEESGRDNNGNDLFAAFSAETDPAKRAELWQRIKTEAWKMPKNARN